MTTSNTECKLYCPNEYGELMIFNNFLLFIFILMPIIKHIPKFVITEDNANYKAILRKIHQYTNWNLFMIGCNHILYNYYNIDNIFLSKFIALNSFQIFMLFHLFVLYDKRILFEIVDNKKPILFDLGFSTDTMIQFEYLLINFMVHILPAYLYRNYLLDKLPCEYEMNISIYTILFKFMWALNIFGNFNVISVYLPTFKFCSIKLFNMIVIFDYTTGTLFEIYKHL